MFTRMLLVCSILFVLIGSTIAAPPGTAEQAPPNIVYILADDLGYGDVGCYGSTDIETPRIDRLATEGARLTAWYAQPVCTPSRFLLLTGRHPNRSAG